MNPCSSAAERAIEAVNRLLIIAMTYAWTATLNHQHIVLPSDEADGKVSAQENSAAAEFVRRQN
ncbi:MULTISPECIES: hypothetical protein [unclassified Bradyrhizobium]|uniref:hypothetical protein n=1 Tax=unclassified Bradyrhizobium TaxID=2631580 RepID=UPI002479E5F4|nr:MULTISPECIES: hypothetical protein [unclassified Bradyrhizobium]WGR74044.1 hypothetical protein MTX24_14990 [Bradyrhizobium sp. ISRA426]WGR78879.1 hypothetical protein MTX21_00105 [Bradyrhizobium sp. ISRA430]WGR89283.1 hypothetical protein MTX25_15005 [Bradyrhizobium sp. ISRA432]